MTTNELSVPAGPPIKLGSSEELFFICGPCVIESREKTLDMARKIKGILEPLGVRWIFKCSFDKANRTSSGSYRGLGMKAGLEVLAEVRESLSVPVLTDLHLPEQAAPVASVVDVLQVPAFLCRQTDLLVACGQTGKPVMIKKGQFLAPQDMKFAAEKVKEAGSSRVLLCERGASFGYRELVVDFRSLSVMASLGYPVVFDATHSVQVMGGAGGSSSGNRQYVAMLARAAVAAGVSAVFLECHEDPDRAPSDGPNMLPIESMKDLVSDLLELSKLSLKTRQMEMTSLGSQS